MSKFLLNKYRKTFRSDTLVGLDIGSRSIKLVQLRELSHGWQLVDVQVEDIPFVSERETEKNRTIAQESALIGLVQRLSLVGAKVAISISGPSVIVKPITVPWMTEEELRGHLHLEIERYLPYKRDDVYWDFYSPQSNSTNSLSTMTMYLVAAKRELVDQKVKLVSQVGLHPVVVDLDSFALANMYMVNYESRREFSDLIVNLGPRGFNMVKVGMTDEFYLHDATMGGERSEEVCQQEMIWEVTNEIQKAVEFCRSYETNQSISRVLVTGGYVQMPGVVDRLSSKLQIPVEIVNPFKRFDIAKELFDSNTVRKASVLAGVAVGLALRCGKGK